MTAKKLNNQEATEEMINLEVAEAEETAVENHELDDLFEAEEDAVIYSGANQLNKTAHLTNIAQRIATEILNTVMTNKEEYANKVKASQQSHDAMDDLIGELYTISKDDYKFLQSESSETLEKMIRSQQSKRSRAKSKVMTRENYLTMLTGAVAELLLRDAAGKPKSSGGGAVMGEIGFSAEDLEKLAQFPEDLKKAIRNIQSKKSIMKSKAGFDPQDVRWQQLLRAEQQLKEVRDQGNAAATKKAQEVIDKQKQLEEMLAATDATSPDEAKQLLDAVREMLASK